MIATAWVISISLAYLALLFLIAFIANRYAAIGKGKFLTSPLVYTLSIAVYCTSWTFYGAVGSAARSGLEYTAIYLGPTLVFLGWWFILRKMLHIAKSHRITSIADFISSRYGKSNTLAIVVTLMAVLGTTPYISLQLKAVSTSFTTLTTADEVKGSSVTPLDPSAESASPADLLWPEFLNSLLGDTALWVAISLAFFTILFGTRNLSADENHQGVVAAIAFESLVKLLALVAVGLFVIYGIGDGLRALAQKVASQPELQSVISFEATSSARWLTLLFLSATAILCLPRQFQVTIVEAPAQGHLRTASWLFPSYLLLISLFVIPIALTGLIYRGPANMANPDMFVLTLPLQEGQKGLSMLAFLGGLSSATSMVIVASMALSIMVSNHVIMPALLNIKALNLSARHDLSGWILTIRRLSILMILGLGYLYYRVSEQSDALASIGLISFAGIAQFLPALIAGLFWRGGTRNGAIAGLLAGFSLWAFTLILPGLSQTSGLFAAITQDGLFGFTQLRPQALFSTPMGDPLVHALIWSMLANILAFITVSLLDTPNPMERLQMSLFVDAFRHWRADTAGDLRSLKGIADFEELQGLSTRMIGARKTRALFAARAHAQGRSVAQAPLPDPDLIADVERAVAGTVGAASARFLVSSVVKGETLDVDEVIKILDETQQVVAYSQKLERQSKELQDTAAELQAANSQLKRLDKLKDDFLSRVSHELRTPMTSIRSMSEILKDELITPNTDAADRSTIIKPEVLRFLDIIVSECERLTRLLNDVLDLSSLENTDTEIFELEPLSPATVLYESMDAVEGMAQQLGVHLDCRADQHEVLVQANRDRLKQVLINLVSNGLKFNDNKDPWVRVQGYARAGLYVVEVADNGPGIAPEDHRLIFSKFARRTVGQQGPDQKVPLGNGLGLAISHQIIQRFHGRLSLKSVLGKGAVFTLELPLLTKTA